MDLMDLFERFWGLLVAVGSGIGGLIAWKNQRDKSNVLLFVELEKLKIKIIEKTTQEVEYAKAVSDKTIILNELKRHCPECYEAVMKRLSNESKDFKHTQGNK